MSSDSTVPIVLFLCTGNYYRSRYAELLFNAWAPGHRLAWRADSRALALERGADNVGPISAAVIEACAARGVALPQPLRFPLAVCEADLRAACRVIALKEAEHRPLLSERFSGWQDCVEYWHVHDLDCGTVADALRDIETGIAALLRELTARARDGSDAPRATHPRRGRVI
jgi:low molecular weight protein-tyrosine phosphatase